MATKTALPNGNSIPDKAHTAKLQSQKAAVAWKRPKTNSKKLQDEGLLATLGGLVCDHQLGMLPTSTLNLFA
jgi:acyl-CoA-dependent ceramide synthase